MSALTKMLIVLQLVFAVAVSVLLALMVYKQEDYKMAAAVNSARVAANGASLVAADKAVLDAGAKVAAAENAKNEAERKLAQEREAWNAKDGAAQNAALALQGQVSALSDTNRALVLANATAASSNALKDAELKELREKMAPLNTRLAEETRRNNELASQVRADELAIRKLQEQLTAGAAAGAVGPSGGQVQALSSGAAMSAAVNAKITNVLDSAGRVLVELPLGSRDGITQNTQLFIYRSTGFVANAVVERVTPTASVAVVTLTKEGATVQAGDTISTIGR